jgi:hypothetical protein
MGTTGNPAVPKSKSFTGERRDCYLVETFFLMKKPPAPATTMIPKMYNKMLLLEDESDVTGASVATGAVVSVAATSVVSSATGASVVPGA